MAPWPSRCTGSSPPIRKVSLCCAVVMPVASTRARARVPVPVFDGRMGEVVVVRHGATEWSRSGQHTGVTDLPLLPDGEKDGRRLRPVLAARHITHAFVSPLARARRTAELAGLDGGGIDCVVDGDLVEVDYGAYEG